MPKRPPIPCRYPGCPVLVEGGRYCDQHRKQERKQQDSRRGTAAQRGYDGRWQRYRKWFLKRNPLCVKCQENGNINSATVVDHINPHKGDRKLFWDPENHQALCKRCHDRKTVKEDGGFGNG
jgi:5-methylcytosine-specific restriction protein A